MEKAMLVCALADAPFIVPGTIFGKRCSMCSAEVMIAPSGQALLRDNDLAIMCLPCAQKKGAKVSVGPTAEQLAEVKTATWNPRRQDQ